MEIFEQLGDLSNNLPDEVRQVLLRADSSNEVLKGLENLYTVNELEFNTVRREIEKLEDREQQEKTLLLALPETESRQRRVGLMTIQRLRKQMDNYESRLNIFEKNMALHLSLQKKVQDIEAMKLRGVNEEGIDRIVMEYEEGLEKYSEALHAGEQADHLPEVVRPIRINPDLAKIEKEIFGKNFEVPVPAPPKVTAAPVELPRATEKPIQKRIPLDQAMAQLGKEIPVQRAELERELELE